MKLVLAEKPSVAREIASVLGVTKKEVGYLRGKDCCVTWALGHLVSLAMPEEYENKVLPIVPHPFKLVIRKKRKGRKYIDDTAALRQIDVIKKLFEECTDIIVATDAGREGELIFRNIYSYLQCRKPFARLWINSLTEHAIKLGFENLLPGYEFENLASAARGRSQADWLLGINASRALSLASGGGIYSLGRVQTPTLSMICRRYYQYASFRPQKFYHLLAEHRKDFFEFKSISKLKFASRAEAEIAFGTIQKSNVAHVSDLRIKEIVEPPPLLYDLTTLQKDCNIKFDLSAEDTLAIAQQLYEMKFISYPRTGSRYVPEDVFNLFPKLVRALNDFEDLGDALKYVKWGRFNRRVVNDLKVTDHHAILTTEKVPTALVGNAAAVYKLIALRVLESIDVNCVKEGKEADIMIGDLTFITKGIKVIDPGWRAVKGAMYDDTNDDVAEIPELLTESFLKISSLKILEKTTKPKPLYTEAALLAAMQNAGKEMEGDERDALAQIGIGTPATRADIIESLIDREYVVRQKKSLAPTAKGLGVFELVKDKRIADLSMTAQWEMALNDIENGKMTLQQFMNGIIEYTTSITAELVKMSVSGENINCMCPKCHVNPVVVSDRIIECTNQSCDLKIYRLICGVQLNLETIRELMSVGRTGLVKGFSSRSGKAFDAYVFINEQFQTGLDIVSKERG